MTGDVIKSFLVGLGFDVDENSLAKFNKSIATASLRITALYSSIKIASAGIAYGISKISEGFEQLGYEYKIIAPAINKALILRQEMLRAYSAAGVNLTKVVQASVKLNMSLTKTRYAFEAIYRSVASRFFDLLTKQSDAFRNKIYANMPKIQKALERFVKFVFKALEATIQLGNRVWSILSRVYDFFVMLDKKTDGWSTAILAVIAAWQLLNLKFLATPLGMLVALGLALLTLYDDFKTFQEGGDSFINWGDKSTKTILGIVAAVGALVSGVLLATTALRALAIAQGVVNAVMALNPIWRIVLALTALISGLAWADAKWNIFGGHVSGFFTKMGSFFTGNTPTNIQNSPQGVPSTTPLSGWGGSHQNQNNVNLQQQVHIGVTGVADAAGAGKAVGDAVQKQNWDLQQNMQGAINAGPPIPEFLRRPE